MSIDVSTNKFELDFIGIGVGKSGTTWFAEKLAEHPEIFIPRVKEIEYFIADNPQNHNYEKGIDWYKSFFVAAGLNQKIGEFTATYYRSPNTAKRIKKSFPNVKIIICLRNPVDVIYSTYWWRKSMPQVEEISKTFEEYIKERPDFLDICLYYEHLRHYFDLFNKENIKVYLTDDIKNDAQDTLGDAYKFIGVRGDFINERVNEKVNSSLQIRFSFLSKPIALIVKKLKSSNISPEIRKILYGKLGVKKIVNSLLRKPFKYPKMADSTRNELIEYYKKDIKMLEKLIERDLDHWI